MCFEPNRNEFKLKIYGYNILFLTKNKMYILKNFTCLSCEHNLKIALLHFRLSEFQSELDQLKEEYLF